MRSQRQQTLIGYLMAGLILLGTSSAFATTLQHRNVAGLIRISDSILVGTVAAVSDGFDGSVPYTEVTLHIDESIKGQTSGTYTFRQFGLLAPRPMPDGRLNLNVSPDGWPRFGQGEDVLVFLYRPAALTGLRTTVGLLQGKFTIAGETLTNGVNNQGLFRNVSVPSASLSEAEQELLSTSQGPVDADTFLAFVRKAVQQDLFQ